MPADPELSKQTAGIMRKFGLRCVTVYQAAGAASPCIVALNPLRPMLVWPASLSATISERQQQALIVHELAHVKRLDHLTGWLELIAAIVWWWNPLFWYVRNQVRQNAELACDSWVLSELPHHRRAYAETLLNICAAAGSQKPMHAIGISTASRRFLTMRLTMIMKGTAPSRISRLGVAGCALLALLSAPSWAQQIRVNAASGEHEAAPPALSTGDPVQPIEIMTTAPSSQLDLKPVIVAGSKAVDTVQAEPQQTALPLSAPADTLELRTLELKAVANATAATIEFNQQRASVEPTAVTYLDTLFHAQHIDIVSQSLSSIGKVIETARLKLQSGTLAPIDIVALEAEEARLRQRAVFAKTALQASQVAHRWALLRALNDRPFDAASDGYTGIGLSNFRPAPVDVSVAIIGADATIRQQTSKEAIESAGRLRSAAQSLQTARVERLRLESGLQETQRQFEGRMATTFQVVQGIRDVLEANDEELQAVLDYRKALMAFDTVLAATRSADPSR
jgi:hypothetical protein